MLSEEWRRIVESVSYALQPIISAHTGGVYGFEALLRGVGDVGFSTIDHFFDRAAHEGVLYDLDLALRQKALARLIEVQEYFAKEFDTQETQNNIKLFYNLDMRILEMTDYKPGRTLKMLEEMGIDQSRLCFELSEKQKFTSFTSLRTTLTIYKQQGYKVAIDDFGEGYAGFEVMYHTNAEIIKLGRFLIDNIDKEHKKRLFVEMIVRLAHAQGMLVVAEGIERIEEFYLCRELGCDLMQGYFIQRPTLRITDLVPTVAHVVKLIENDRRASQNDAHFIANNLEVRPTAHIDMTMKELLELFRAHPEIEIFPVVTSGGEPVGVVWEHSLRRYLYSPVGIDLISHRKVREYLLNVPVVEMTISLEELLALVANDENEPLGVLISRDYRYVGYLSPNALLGALHEKSLHQARDQNPLTKLPGNRVIEEEINRALSSSEPYYIAYVDLDNFKPFNDRFGFRTGDRAIMLMAQMAQSLAHDVGGFVGHVGGDDFVLVLPAHEKVQEMIAAMLADFHDAAADFYDKEERKKGSYKAKDRFGNKREFSLLGASAAVVLLAGERPNREALDMLLAALKKEAKESPEHLSFRCVDASMTIDRVEDEEG